MKLFYLLPIALNAGRIPTSKQDSSKIRKWIPNPTESDAGIYSESEINNGLGLFENDIIENQSDFNIQTDLTYRWPDGKLYIDVGTDVSPNVVGVLHQVSPSTVLSNLILYQRRYGNWKPRRT